MCAIYHEANESVENRKRQDLMVPLTAPYSQTTLEPKKGKRAVCVCGSVGLPFVDENKSRNRWTSGLVFWTYSLSQIWSVITH